jgi:ABC-type multidrug transport system fused ATPase/permease subunit
MVVYSLVLVVVMIFKPTGLMGDYDFSLSRLLERGLNLLPQTAGRCKGNGEGEAGERGQGKMSAMSEKVRMVPVPSVGIIPERDVDKTPILEARHLGIDFGGLTAVDEFNLTIGRTEIAGLIGPNGGVKTTVFNLLTKVYHPTRGTILLDGATRPG